MTGWLLGKLILLAIFGGALGLLVWWLRRQSGTAFREAMASIDRRTMEAIARVTAEAVRGKLPAIVVTLRLPPSFDRRTAIMNGVRLAEALSQYECSLGGKGLTPASLPTTSNNPHQVRLVLTAVSGAGAGERLAKVAQAVTEALRGVDTRLSVAVSP